MRILGRLIYRDLTIEVYADDHGRIRSRIVKVLRGSSPPHASVADAMAAGRLMIDNEIDAPAKYVPDVTAALQHLQRLFEACGDGSEKLDSGWVMTVATKAMEALREGIQANAANEPIRSGKDEQSRQ